MVFWEGLGQKGKEFVVRSYDAGLSQKPIRLYAGIDNEASLEKRVDLILQEFERTKAFERKAVMIFTPSGTGWVNPVAVEAAEEALDGDIASVAMQYSNNAAVLQYLIDKDIPGEASSLLFSKLRARLDALPKDKQPKLYVYGESLGSLGSQDIFAGKSAGEIAGRVDGALWVGSPSASKLWSSLFGKASTQIVRFGTSAEDFESIPGQWGPSRVAFLYNATDPVVWFTTRLAYQPPAWLKEPRAEGIDKHMQWRPVVTMGHIFFELFPGRRPPSGVGHTYDEKIPCAVAIVLQAENSKMLGCDL
ncbi:MAG: alpha/beta-hydrolase family protein [Candidatus Wildermuthbacteria bacterium]|nr:alpha/beta-hydrolase family protein [Candidatus Wildermuthbacteria bacterium]